VLEPGAGLPALPAVVPAAAASPAGAKASSPCLSRMLDRGFDRYFSLHREAEVAKQPGGAAAARRVAAARTACWKAWQAFSVDCKMEYAQMATYSTEIGIHKNNT
jgi:hypothetical protein